MSKQRIRGRIRIESAGETYTVELRNDGVWVRKFRSHSEWLVPLEFLLRLCNKQTELFTQKEMTGNTTQVEAVEVIKPAELSAIKIVEAA